MATTNLPIFAQSPLIGIATLTSPSAITSRANITGTTGLVQLTPTSTNGKRVDQISTKAKATMAAGCIGIWLYNGTTSFLIDEILVSAITASTTAVSDSASKFYKNMVLPPTFQLYVSSTINQDINIFSYGGDY